MTALHVNVVHCQKKLEKNHYIPTILKEKVTTYNKALPSHFILEASMRNLLFIYLFDAHCFKFCALSKILLVSVHDIISNFELGKRSRYNNSLPDGRYRY